MGLSPESGGRHLDTVILLLLFALFLLASPLTMLWASADSPWYLPYLIWLGIIALIAWVQHRLSA
jgi:hypothetical protein